MDMTGEQLLPTPRERVWSALMDTETLRRAIPGCESIDDEGDGVLRVALLAAVGPVRARFKGRLRHQDLQAPARYTIAFEGDGGLAGFARGSADVALHEATVAGLAGTRLVYSARAQVGGRMAQIGSRLVDATAAKLSAQFFERLSQSLSGAAETAAMTASANINVAAPASASATMPPAQIDTARVAPAPLRELSDAGRSADHLVTIRMPAWAWIATLVSVGTTFAWVATR